MRGVFLIALGLAVVYVPIQFVLSTYFLGIGSRMLWLSACEGKARATGTDLAGRPRGTPAERPTGEVRRVT